MKVVSRDAEIQQLIEHILKGFFFRNRKQVSISSRYLVR